MFRFKHYNIYGIGRFMFYFGIAAKRVRITSEEGHFCCGRFLAIPIGSSIVFSSLFVGSILISVLLFSGTVLREWALLGSFSLRAPLVICLGLHSWDVKKVLRN